MSRPSSPLPDDLGEYFSVRTALEAGVSAGRLRSRSLDAPFHGVRMQASATTPDADHGLDDASPYALEARRLTAEIVANARAFATRTPTGWFYSGVTAAILWGLPVPLRVLRGSSKPPPRGRASGAARRLDVAVFSPARASRAAGVRGHQLSPKTASVRTLDGLRLTSPATTWALLADELTVDELIEVGDAIVRIPRRRGMARGTEADALGTVAQLQAATNTPYRRQAARLADALDQVRVGSASPGETRIRVGCSRGDLPDPCLDYDIVAADGTPIGFTEIAYPRYRLLIEYEGDHHRTDPRQWQRDVDKHAACVDEGWEVLRLTSKHVYPTTDPAVARIRKALLRRGWRP